MAPLLASPPELRSGRTELDSWLADHARSATQAGSARTCLAHSDGEPVGYFALAAGSVEPVRAGTRTRRGMPRHAIPVVLLARLAVSESLQRQGLGRELVRHVCLITLQVARLVAVRALVVDAVDEPTARFYAAAGFTQNDANRLRLEILVKDIEALAGAEASR